MRDKKKENINQDNIDHGYEAYKTLIDWVKSVPESIKKIEENGNEDELIKYKKQVKMVLKKLQDIRNDIKNV